jgi:flagellar FliJ protein
VEDARQKHTLLSSYRDEYVNRFQQTMANGFTPLAYRNYQNFMDKLDTAIRGQEQILRDAETRAGAERDTWRESERKRISYDALKTRAERVAEKNEAKREQKQSDEAAARKFLYKR